MRFILFINIKSMLVLSNCFCLVEFYYVIYLLYTSDYSYVMKLMYTAQKINRYYIKFEAFFT